MSKKFLVVSSVMLGFVLACSESEKAKDVVVMDTVSDEGGLVPDTYVPDAFVDKGGAKDLQQADEFPVDFGLLDEVTSLPEDVIVDLPPELPPEDVTIDSLPETSPADEGVSEPDIPPQDVPSDDHGGAGTGTCVDISDCVTQQNCADQPCYEMCIAVGTPEAQQQFLGLIQCGNQNCGQYGKDKPMQGAYCVYSQCRQFAEPCTKTGTSSCMQTLQCAQPCGQNNQACVQACYEQASYDALLKILAIGACAEQNCPTKDQTCLTTHCLQQIMACTSG
jgi:hypothetical protein